jgi:NAD+ kinase
MILVDPHNALAKQHAEALLARVTPDDLPDDLHLVFGGDGFMLRSVHTHGYDGRYLGFNAGRVGFLLNDVHDWDATARALLEQQWTEHAFHVLKADLELEDGTHVITSALNDVAIERSTGQTAHLELTIDGESVVDRLVADGIIVSTALGSTAYTVSAGGSACHPSLELLAVTPICPHRPRLAPFLLPASAGVAIRVIDGHRRPIRAVADGRTIDGVVGMRISADPNRVRIGWLDGADFTARMVRKILKP